MPAAIDVAELTVVRGRRTVLHGLDLSVDAGTVTGLLGPSGCGKTTLLRAIVGVQRVAGGRVSVLGLPAGAPALRARIGYQPQFPSIYADLTVRENLRYFGRLVGARRARIDEVLSTVDLTPLARRRVGTLSGGECSRVSLATALLGEPEILVLDEPTVGLDPVLRVELWRTFHALAERGTTLVISSHVMDEARACDALLLMRAGTILEHTTPDALRRRTGEADLGDAFLSVIREAAA